MTDAAPGPAHRDQGVPALLGQPIRDARKAARKFWGREWTVDRVAYGAGLRRPALVAIERGDRLPSLAALTRLHALLPRVDGVRRTQRDLAVWLARWTRAQVERAAADDRIESDDLRAELRAAAGLLDGAVGRPRPFDLSAPRTLVDFPVRFPATVALVGDRRERPPRSRGDLFAAAAAVTDASFLPLVGTGVVTSLRSDKLVAVGNGLPEAELEGVDLLVVAGPNVNWATRRVNAGALFRFEVPARWERWEAAYRTEPHLGSRPVLAAFAALAATAAAGSHAVDRAAVEAGADPEWRSDIPLAAELVERLLARGEEGGVYTEDEVIGSFQSVGHCDPVLGQVHGPARGEMVDHAVVSLAPSPFDPDRLAIMVGGTHGPGTAHALRMLVERPGDFAAHPFGGVLEVRVGEYHDWSSRFQAPATLRWLTPEYTPAALRQRLAEALEAPAAQRPPAFADRTTEQLAAAALFVDRLTGDEPWPSASVGSGAGDDGAG